MMDPTKHADYRAQRADHAAALDRLFAQYPPDVKAFMRARFDFSMYPLGFAETFAAALHAFRPVAAIGGLQDKKAEEWIAELLKANGGDNDMRAAWLLDHEEDIVQMHRALVALRYERDRIERVAKMVGESADRANARMMAVESQLAALQDEIAKVADMAAKDAANIEASVNQAIDGKVRALRYMADHLRTLVPGSGDAP